MNFMSASLVTACTAVLGAGLVSSSPSALAEEIRESSNMDLGYATVAEALAGLRGRAGAQISQQGGWTIATESASSTIWSFTPPEHPAHPSAVKRTVVSQGGSS